MSKQIKDPVHGYIEVPDELVPLLDAQIVQRLHYIKQLGFAYLVYPGANHTRFEHSIGAMHLAGRLARTLGLEKDETLLVQTAGLLHDVGHGPFSHASERLADSFSAFSHDEICSLLENDAEVALILEENGTGAKEIADIVAGRHALASIIHGDLDVDRMDYLLRDAHYTGVPYGTLDAGRLIHSLVNTSEGLAVKESGIAAAESLLIARTLMGPSVYYHHVSRIAEEMFLSAGKSALDADAAPAFLRMDDISATAYLMNAGGLSRELMTRIHTRRIYKRAVYASREMVDMVHFSALGAFEKERLHQAICDAANAAPEQVILDIPPIRKEMRMQIQIANGHSLVSFEDMAPLLSIMNNVRAGQWRLGVYCPAELRDAVGKAAREILHVRKPSRQNTLSDVTAGEL
ncbi:MAG TPA: HD domain-containing protein [Methanocorpusculum sp.]|nr:HD domain-containing protein [Methanocorpusculum sp.]